VYIEASAVDVAVTRNKLDRLQLHHDEGYWPVPEPFTELHSQDIFLDLWPSEELSPLWCDEDITMPACMALPR